MAGTNREDAGDALDTRLPPDPFAAVLPALAALGAVTSIAAIHWSGQDKLETRTRAKRKPVALLRDLETCALGLNDIFQRFKKHPRVFAGEGGRAAAPLKFGVHGQRILADSQRLYQQLVSDIASRLTQSVQTAFDVMTAIEDGDIEAEEDVFFALGEQQEKLNGLFQTRASLKVAVDTGAEVAHELMRLAGQFKVHQRTS